eukprot:TRINITY_DN41518_c0_g1_i1.p1 TRINITY_DN41518_c0_g1~~TRINITY_DN41518_c0_g1_i1.p1  ORF type:complete len:1043 (-),score=197.89 TRINITY_DN41518_c0_g1_i1:273-3401(-)
MGRVVPAPVQVRVGPVEEWLPRTDDHPALHSAFVRRAPLTYASLLTQLQDAECKAWFSGRRVCIIVKDHPAELAVLLLIVANAGGTACPLDPKLSPEELAEAVEQLQCSLVVTLGTQFKLSLKAEIHFIEAKADATTCGQIIWPHNLELAPAVKTSVEAPALLLRTSGTTSKPKVVPLYFENLRHGAAAIADSLGLRADDICLNAMPYFHIGGISCSLLAVLCSGSQVLCMPQFDAGEFIELLRCDPQPTWYYAVPTIHRAVMLHLEATGHPPGAKPFKLRLARSGAAHLPHKDGVGLAAALGCQVLPTCSMTECMPVCSTALGYKMEKEGTVGKPLAVSLKIADDDGNELACGEEGNVMLRGPAVMRGYEGLPPAESFVDDWFVTGDRGRLDQDGDVFLCGRTREMVKRGGEQISLFEVDNVVNQHAAVQLCVAFGIVNPFWGEEVAAAVVLRKGFKADVVNDIMAMTAKKLPAHKVPKQILVVDDKQLPKTATGKYLRGGLANKLGANPVDLDAEKQFSAFSAESAHAPTKSVPAPLPSKALQGLRPFISAAVVYHHIGDFEAPAWKRIQNTTISIPLFMFLAGFTTAASMSKAVNLREWKDFCASRIGPAQAAHYVISLLALALWCLRCGAGTEGPQCYSPLNKLFSSHSSYVIGTVLFTPLGFCMPNSVTWFQAISYLNIRVAPFIDRYARLFGAWLLAVQILVLLVVAVLSIQYFEYAGQRVGWPAHAITMRKAYSFESHIWVFAAGMLSWHLFRQWGSVSSEVWRRRWGILTDLLTLNKLFLYVTAFTDDDIITDTYGRVFSSAVRAFGVERNGIPLIALWIVGLAVGEGYTARFLSRRILTRLSSLTYGVYLCHPQVGWMYWYATRGTEWQPWFQKYPGTPMPVSPLWETPLILAGSFATAWVINEYIAPPMVPTLIRLESWFCSIVCCCWLWRICPKRAGEEPGASVLPLERVQLLIRKLTGQEVALGDKLDALGLDSFGAAALVAQLRSHFPRARELNVAVLQDLETVGALVAFLEGGKLELRASDVDVKKTQ